MKKTIVILLALILAGPSALRADPQDDLRGKVVRISGAVNGMGVVVLYKAYNFIMLDEVDGSKQQKFNLINQDYQLAILAESREAYLQMLSDGLTPAEIAAEAKLVPTVPAFSYLYEIAENARKKRIGTAIPFLISGGTTIIGFIYLNVWHNGYYSFSHQLGRSGYFLLASHVIAFGVGVLLLSKKSSAERSYDRYLKEKKAAEKSNKLALNIGLDRHGFSLGVRYCFQ
jgi:hypothetical protein